MAINVGTDDNGGFIEGICPSHFSVMIIDHNLKNDYLLLIINQIRYIFAAFQSYLFGLSINLRMRVPPYCLVVY